MLCPNYLCIRKLTWYHVIELPTFRHRQLLFLMLLARTTVSQDWIDKNNIIWCHKHRPNFNPSKWNSLWPLLKFAVDFLGWRTFFSLNSHQERSMLTVNWHDSNRFEYSFYSIFYNFNYKYLADSVLLNYTF